MKLRMVPIFLAALCGFAVTNASATVLTFYNNRAAWEAAVGGSFVEQNFNSFTSGVSYEAAPVDVGDFTVSVSGSTFGFIWHNIGPVSNLNDVNGSPQINAAVGAIGGTSLSFDYPIYAFGADWQGISDSRTTSFNVNETLLAIPNLNGGFFGFTSDTAFSSALLFLSSGEPDGFGIDNAVYSPESAAVPEPTTLALLGAGLVALRARRRRTS